jgi:hypothetical protein
MPSRTPPSWLAAAALLAGARVAAAAPKLPPEADQALTKAEKVLGKTQGDERIVACIDAIQPLQTVVRLAPDYAYPVGLLAECAFLNDDWEGAITHYTQWLTLVPPEARVGPVLEKVQKAIQRLRIAYMKTGRALSELPTPRAKDAPAPNAPPPAPEQKAAEEKAAQQAAHTLEPQPGRADVSAETAPIELPPPPPPDEPPAPEEPPPARQFAIRAGYSPLAGVVGLGAEARFSAFHVALGTGAMPLSVGAGASLPIGPGRAYAEAHAFWIGSSLLTERVASRAAFGATIGYDFRPVRFVSVKLGVGGGYEQLLSRPWRLTFDAAVGPVFAF